MTKLPCATCKGKCCTYAPIEKEVWERVKHKVPADAVITEKFQGTSKHAFFAYKPETDGVCSFLSEQGKCSIYTYRPRSCRAVGVDPRVPCPVVAPKRAMQKIMEMAIRINKKGIVLEGQK